MKITRKSILIALLVLTFAVPAMAAKTIDCDFRSVTLKDFPEDVRDALPDEVKEMFKGSLKGNIKVVLYPKRHKAKSYAVLRTDKADKVTVFRKVQVVRQEMSEISDEEVGIMMGNIMFAGIDDPERIHSYKMVTGHKEEADSLFGLYDFKDKKGKVLGKKRTGMLYLNGKQKLILCKKR